MAITYPLSIPTSGFTSLDFSMIEAVGMGTSPYTFSQEIFEHQGKRWSVQANVRQMNRDDAEEWVAFLAALSGRKGSFLMGDPIGVTPRGVATGTPLVKGTAQTGQSLNIDGCTASTTNWLKKGDYVQLGSGSSTTLHKSMTDVSSDSGGNATLDLWPGMRVAPADNAAITLINTLGIWRLSSNERTWRISDAVVYGISFSAIEKI